MWSALLLIEKCYDTSGYELPFVNMCFSFANVIVLLCVFISLLDFTADVILGHFTLAWFSLTGFTIHHFLSGGVSGRFGLRIETGVSVQSVCLQSVRLQYVQGPHPRPYTSPLTPAQATHDKDLLRPTNKLSDLLHPLTPCPTILGPWSPQHPGTNLQTVCVSVAAPHTSWNSLPPNIFNATSVVTFNKNLKPQPYEPHRVTLFCPLYPVLSCISCKETLGVKVAI